MLVRLFPLVYPLSGSCIVSCFTYLHILMQVLSQSYYFKSVQVWWSKLVTVGVHLALGALLFRQAQQVDLQDTQSITSCYMLVWKLFYSEYLLIPFFR